MNTQTTFKAAPLLRIISHSNEMLRDPSNRGYTTTMHVIVSHGSPIFLAHGNTWRRSGDEVIFVQDETTAFALIEHLVDAITKMNFQLSPLDWWYSCKIRNGVLSRLLSRCLVNENRLTLDFSESINTPNERLAWRFRAYASRDLSHPQATSYSKRLADLA